MLLVYGHHTEPFPGDGDLNELLIFYKLINFSQSQSATMALNKSAVSECVRQNVELFENFF